MFTISIVETIELTFELPDNEKQCFYEEIGQNNESTVEYQVVTGGNYDVDVQIFSPKNQRLYSEIRKQYGSHTWKADICFSNEFSTFSHKIVYMDWKIGDEKLVVPTNLAAMTMLETLSNSIHEKLKVVDDIQTHHRLRESGGRKSAEDLNERVLWWSLGQAIVMLVIFFAQVTVLKSFFSDRKNAGNRC
uniref:GOLD domain-containing protein n=1 Tax=Romanomermis culicivorax TaxID=13658 RepID=A0A915JA90_ROMCU